MSDYFPPNLQALLERALRRSVSKKVKSWWCQPCSQESYTVRCKYCGKSEAEEQ